MPTIRAVLVIQDRKSRAVVVPDKQIPTRDMLEAIRVLSQHIVPANKLATVQLATGSWALKTLTDLPVGRTNLAILTHKLYPPRKKIALADHIYEILLQVEDWAQAEAVEEAIKKKLTQEEIGCDERRLKEAEDTMNFEMESNKKVVADIRDRFGALRMATMDPETNQMTDNGLSDLPGAIHDQTGEPNRIVLDADLEAAGQADGETGIVDRFQIMSGTSNKISECLSKFSELWKNNMWFKILVFVVALILIGVPVVIVIIYSQPKS